MITKERVKEEVLEWSKSILLVLAFFWVFTTFIAQPYMVDGPSMNPTLENSERLIVNKFIYRIHPPQHGDIIVFEYPSDRSRQFIKRVIAVGGDTIEITEGMVFVNGKLLNEPYISEPSKRDYPMTTIPDGTVFVMGDNRNNSEDSRFADVGFVPLSYIHGMAAFVYSPVSSFRVLR